MKTVTHLARRYFGRDQRAQIVIAKGGLPRRTPIPAIRYMLAPQLMQCPWANVFAEFPREGETDACALRPNTQRVVT